MKAAIPTESDMCDSPVLLGEVYTSLALRLGVSEAANIDRMRCLIDIGSIRYVAS